MWDGRGFVVVLNEDIGLGHGGITEGGGSNVIKICYKELMNGPLCLVSFRSNVSLIEFH